MSNNKWTPFQQALIDSVTEDYEVALQNEHSFAPSEKLERWAQKMIGKKSYRTPVSRIARAVLIAALVTALLTISALAIPAIREAIINFFLMEYDDHYSITFDSEQAATAPQKIETVYRVDAVPDGYILASEDISVVSVSLFWMNAEGEYISYMQWTLPEDATSDTWFGLNNENERQSTIMGDYQVEVIQNQDNRKLIWTNNSYIFVLEFSADLAQEEIEKMFFSWKPAE